MVRSDGLSWEHQIFDMNKDKTAPATNMDVCEVPRWKLLKSNLSNLEWSEFIERSEDPEAVRLDVRTSAEFEIDALPNAVNVNYLSTDLVEQLEELDLQKVYYVYCRTSRRSVRVCTLMMNMGFPHVYNLKDGLNGKSMDEH